MAVKTAEVDLLSVQACESLTYLSVCAQIFCEDGVNDLLRLVFRALTTGHATRIIAMFAPIIRRCSLRASLTLLLQVSHFEVSVVHLSPQILVILEVFQSYLIYFDRIIQIFGFHLNNTVLCFCNHT